MVFGLDSGLGPGEGQWERKGGHSEEDCQGR